MDIIQPRGGSWRSSLWTRQQQVATRLLRRTADPSPAQQTGANSACHRRTSSSPRQPRSTRKVTLSRISGLGPSAQSGNDEELAIAAYLRARARPHCASRSGTGDGKGARAEPSQARRGRSRGPAGAAPGNRAGQRCRCSVPGIATEVQVRRGGSTVASVVAVIWLIVSPQESGSSGAPTVSVVAPSSKGSAPASPLGRAKPVVGSASGDTSKSASGDTSESDSVATARSHQFSNSRTRATGTCSCSTRQVDARRAEQCDRMERAKHRVRQPAPVQ